jgi:recombinational DNA repair protein (RecF pathway)
MKTLGISPQLNSCTACRTNISTHEHTHFSAANGGIICNSCHASSRPQDSRYLSGDTLAILRRWQASHDFKLMQNCNCNPKQKQEIEHILGSFLPYHLDLSPACRAVAYQTINIPVSTPIHQTTTV